MSSKNADQRASSSQVAGPFSARNALALLGNDAAWTVVSAFVFALLTGFYFKNLDAFLINDDEGSYLYAAWRIALGELPYRDFLTPQLPAFLMPGGFMMKLMGPDVWPARAFAAILCLLSGVILWFTLRRLFGTPTALLASSALLLHPDLYLHGRTFRSDPFMLCGLMLGLYFFSLALFPGPDPRKLAPPRRGFLAAAGIAFGLATLAKLFGPFAMAGCIAFLLHDAWQRKRPLIGLVKDLGVLGLSSALTLLIGIGSFMFLGGDFQAGFTRVYEAVFKHHTAQNAGQSLWQNIIEGIDFYERYLRLDSKALLIFCALAMLVIAFGKRDRALNFFAWQMPTIVVFLFLSREKYARHLIYLLPALTSLFALACAKLATLDGSKPKERAFGLKRPAFTNVKNELESWSQSPGRLIALALIAALLVPWWLLDRDHRDTWESGTRPLGDLIALLTQPDDMVFSDYSELNFYARRPTSYSAASLSAGAAGSGQIRWSKLKAEFEAAGQAIPRLLVLDTDPRYAHLRFLQDEEDFRIWVAEHYGAPAGHFQRHSQRYELYRPLDDPLPIAGYFEDGPKLLVAAAAQSQVESG